MVKSEILATLEDTALVAMLRLPSADDTLGMAEILIEAGIPCLQVPMTVPGATEIITELREKYPGRGLVGAGTVLTAKAADACLAAGAQFIVSPVVNPDIIKICNEAGAVVVPGALTPTEIVSAWEAGADMVRIYPCAAMGGPEYIKFLRAPLPDIRLMPAGGVSLQTASSYISAGATVLEIDRDLVDLDALRTGRKQEIVTSVNLYLDVVVEALSLASGRTDEHMAGEES